METVDSIVCFLVLSYDDISLRSVCQDLVRLKLILSARMASAPVLVKTYEVT